MSEEELVLSVQMWIEKGVDCHLLSYTVPGKSPEGFFGGGSVGFPTRLELREALMQTGISPSLIESEDGAKFVINVSPEQLHQLGLKPEMPPS